MLRTRVITALVLLPLALAAIFLLSPAHFAWAAAALLLVGSWEFHRLAALPTPAGGIALLVLQAALLAALLVNWTAWTASPILFFALGCVIWALMLLRLGRFHPERGVNAAYRLAGFVEALLAISFAWAALAWLRAEPAGSSWILLLLLTIWAADIGAYFTGRAIGGRKLAPKISPGKTWAGFYGGLVSAAALVPLAGTLLPGIEAAPIQLALLGIVTAVVSVGGDLFISLHKRTVGLKDTGRIFPGHGGVLDRLDSLLAGAPFFALGKMLLGL